MFYSIFILSLFISNHAFGALVEKYASVVCKLTDPAVESCLKTAIDNVFPKISKGIKEVDLLPINPLYIPLANLTEKGTGPTSLSLEFRNSKHSHINEGTVEDLKFVRGENKLSFKVKIPLFTIDGDYKLGGKILALPIFGEGKTNIIAHDNIVEVKLRILLKPGKNGKTYLHGENISLKLHAGKTSFHFENLFNNKELSENMNKFLNENDQEVLKEIMPRLNDMYTEIFRNILERFFASRPAEEYIIE